jgi:solute carrier family 8 (sodium/calcium exchanger)
VSDIGESIGCALGIPDKITAFTLVALGTSLPDTFASRTAALQDDNADSSVTNVTGSNSVNVFLGCGLTWTMGAVYWWYIFRYEPDGATAERWHKVAA